MVTGDDLPASGRSLELVLEPADLGSRYAVLEPDRLCVQQEDLERTGALAGRQADVVIVVRYLDRNLFPALAAALRPGGMLVYETFTVEQQRMGHPRNPLYMLQPGELVVRKGGQDSSIFVSGGFFELMNDKVTILADSAERAEDIDIARAEEAKKRAEERVELRTQADVDAARAEAALRRSLIRLKVAERVRARRRTK